MSRVDLARPLRERLTHPRELCEALGLLEGYRPVQQAQGGLIIRCPAHGDRSPSCSVTLGPDHTLRVKCFACDFAGNVFTLIASARGLDLRRDFAAVLEEAARLAGLSPDLSRSCAPRPSPAPVPRSLTPHASKPTPALDPATFARVASVLLELCPLEGPVGVGLAFRGILSQARTDGWGELPAPPATDLVAALMARFTPPQLAWIVRRGALLHPEHRLLVPWRRPDGAIEGLQRRYAPLHGDESPPRGVSKYLWPSASLYEPAERLAYGVDAPERHAADEVWICEGAPDVLAIRMLNQAGKLSADRQPRALIALGLPGVTSWARYRDSVLPLCRGRRVSVALDADEAGRAHVLAIGHDAWRAGALEVRDRRPTDGAKDWCELSSRFWRRGER